MTWTVPLHQIEPPTHPEALSDVSPLLERLVMAFGVRPLARLMDVEPGTISNWTSGHRRMSPEMAKRIIDLHDVLTRALQVFMPPTAMQWLVGQEPFLDGARPIDVLVLRGAAPLIQALEGIAAGAYA